MDNNVTSVLQTLIPHPSTLPSSIRPALTTARQSILYALSDTRQFVTGTKVDFELAETQSRSADFNRIRAAIDTANMRSRFR